MQIYQQVRCFNAPLQSSEIAGVKRVVQQKVPEGFNSHGLTFPGFIYVHNMFLKKGRPETLWAVLRNFGYDNNLKLMDDFLPVPSKHAFDQVIHSFFVLLLWKFHFCPPVVILPVVILRINCRLFSLGINNNQKCV